MAVIRYEDGSHAVFNSVQEALEQAAWDDEQVLPVRHVEDDKGVTVSDVERKKAKDRFHQKWDTEAGVLRAK